MFWWLGIIVVFVGGLLIGGFIGEVLKPSWVKRLEAIERGKAAQRWETEHGTLTSYEDSSDGR